LLEKKYWATEVVIILKLFIAFTVRAKKIRVISARNMTEKEKRKYYEKMD
jgi:uncharacterized DUF497 family protein|tara:strand:+ start:32 stop:181 length:150 start_codon:yes stop_codon:yes gene_type:complete